MSRDRAVGTITDINQLWEMNHMLTLLSTEVSTCSVLATTNFGMSLDRAVGTITDINQLWEMNHMLTLLSTGVSTCSVLATTNFGMSLDRAVGTITDINQLWEHFKGGTLQSGACVGASNADAPKGRSGGVWDHDARAA